MAGQYGSERDLLRERARQQRVQDMERQKETPQLPIFGAPIKIHKDDELSKKARSTMGDYDKLKLILRKNELVAMVGVDQQPQTPLNTDKNTPRFPVPASSPSKPNEQQNTGSSGSKKNQKQPDTAKTDGAKNDTAKTEDKLDKRLSLDSHVRHKHDKERKNSASRQRSVSSDRSGRSKGDRRSDIRDIRDNRPPVVKDSKPPSSVPNQPVIPSTSNNHSSASANEAAPPQAKPSITLKAPHRKHNKERPEPDAVPVKQPVDAPTHGHPAKPREPRDTEHNAVPQFTKPNGVVNGLIRKDKPKEHVTDENSHPVSLDQILKEMSCEPLLLQEDIATPKKEISKFSFPTANQKDAISNQLFGPSPPGKTDASPRRPSMGATDGARVSVSTDLVMSEASDGESDTEEVGVIGSVRRSYNAPGGAANRGFQLP